jgi:transketolase
MDRASTARIDLPGPPPIARERIPRLTAGPAVTNPQSDVERLAINTIRTLCMDAVQAANSGHPGSPMGMAPAAYVLWQRFLRFNPTDPAWANRDRFVLSAGHCSTLLYSLLHLMGTRAVNDHDEPRGEPSITLDDLKRFRQLDSKCPGHPEYRWTSGVETTTGPLGQGLATSVGMALAGRWLAAHFNRPGYNLFDYDVYALCGDGCMMEGISAEAASLAGHWKLSNLCWVYDSNKITIEGHTDLAFTDDVATRFLGHGWNVIRVSDANDLEMLDRAFRVFKATTDRPTLIIVESHIAWGAPHKQDTSAAHGEPLGEEEIKLTKRSYGWPEDAKFLVPDGVREHFREGIGRRGGELRTRWSELFEGYRKEYPELANQLVRMQRGELPDGWDKNLPVFAPSPKGVATRDSSGQVQNALAKNIPWLVGGSADLAPSCKTRLTFDGAGDFQAATCGGRNLHFGVREHAMAAVLNGMSLSKLRPFGSTFLIFSDYLRNPLRLSAIMEIPVAYVFTHDSIGVGEDGPTHQPVEQLASLRAMPGVVDLRPADASEIREAWRVLLPITDRPVALVLAKQEVPVIDRARYAPASGLARGGYILADPPGGQHPEAIIIASGSEVALALQAYEDLSAEGVGVRVVSLPSWALFGEQDRAYRDLVLPPAVTARVAVEQAAALGWERWTGDRGTIIGMHSFGVSGPGPEVRRHFGFTAEAVAEAVRACLVTVGTKAGQPPPNLPAGSLA